MSPVITETLRWLTDMTDREVQASFRHRFPHIHLVLGSCVRSYLPLIKVIKALLSFNKQRRPLNSFLFFFFDFNEAEHLMIFSPLPVIAVLFSRPRAFP